MNIAREELVVAAGVDPWALGQRLRLGDPDALQAGALRIRRAGLLAAEAADCGARADRALGSGFLNNEVEVFDAAASTHRGGVLLAERGGKIEETARAVLDVTAALSEAKRRV